MTGIYNRTSKNSNLILFFFIALLLHVVVLSFPVKQKVASRLGQAISVSVVPYKEPATLSPPAEQAAKPVVKSPVNPKAVVPPEPTVSVKSQRGPRVKTLGGPEKKERMLKQTENGRKSTFSETPSDSESWGENEAAHKAVALESEMVPGETQIRNPFESASIAGTMGEGGSGKETPLETKGEGAMTYAMPRYKENPPPQYPRMAKRRGYEGRTILAVEVFENGKVGDVAIAESSGFDILDEAALDSVKTWVFVPGTQNGKPVRQRVMVPIRFDLN